MKVCTKCGIEKDLSEFGKHKATKDGAQTQCKSCRSESYKKWCEANPERDAERKRKWYEENKNHHACLVKKWHENNTGRRADLNKKWREANPNKDYDPERKKRWYEANKSHHADLSKKWALANPERRADLNKKWQKANPGKTQSLTAKRRSAKLNASPLWITSTDRDQIQEFYALAIMQGKASGRRYHVDHIHPLQHHLICGLHMPANLQILEASANQSKSNKFEPYIESECDFTELWQVRSDDRTLIPTQIDRIPKRNPIALIKPRKSRGVSKGQLALF